MPATRLATSTLSNQNISAALLCHTYTVATDGLLYVRLFADQVAGSGDYVGYVTIQRLGAGSFYEAIRATKTAGAGVTAVFFSTIAIPVKATDVVRVYIIGLAGDTLTPDIITEIWGEGSSGISVADILAGVVAGSYTVQYALALLISQCAGETVTLDTGTIVTCTSGCGHSAGYVPPPS